MTSNMDRVYWARGIKSIPTPVRTSKQAATPVPATLHNAGLLAMELAARTERAEHTTDELSVVLDRISVDCAATAHNSSLAPAGVDAAYVRCCR